MRLNISTFSIALVSAFALLMFVLWCLSLVLLVEQQNREHAVNFRHNLHGQVLQLQQKQRLWLQSQYYLCLLYTSPSPRDS